MPPTKKSTNHEKPKGVMIYLAESERAILDADLGRANAYRKKKLSMNELLRQRVFDKNIRKQDQVQIVPVGPAPDIERIMQDAFTKYQTDQSLLVGESAKVVNLLEQVIVAQVEAVRRDLLDMKDEIRSASTPPWEKQH